MARFVKRGKVWQYEISYKEDGVYKKKRKSGFIKKSDAIAEASEVESKLKKGFKISVKDKTLYDYFDQYISVYVKGKKDEKTYRKYVTTKNNIKKYFKELTLKEITRITYQECLNDFSKTHATSSVGRLHIHIKKSIQNALDEGMIPYDFTKYAVIKGGKDGVKDQDKFLNFEEWEKLVNIASQKLDARYSSRFMILIAAVTGMRFGELLGLTWDNVDLDKGYIYVRRAWDYILTNDFCSPKNEQSKRRIPIDDVTVNIMQQFKGDQQAVFEKVQVVPPHQFVFYSARDGIISNKAANKKLKELLKQLGISTNLSMHGLRHTYASVLIYKGVNIMKVSKFLGHQSLNVTMSTYAHIIKELDEKGDEEIRLINHNAYKKEK